MSYYVTAINTTTGNRITDLYVSGGSNVDIEAGSSFGQNNQDLTTQTTTAPICD